MRYDTAIIGSGISGLVCALLLARSGRRVIVFEQYHVPAPVVRGFSRQGIYFDSGFHYAGGLGPGGAFKPLFQHLGLADKLTLVPYAEHGFDRLRITSTGKDIVLPVGFQRLKDTLCKAYPEAESAIETYLTEIEQNWTSFPYLDLKLDLADFSLKSLPSESLATRLREFAPYPDLQSLLSMHALLYGIEPSEASTTLNTQVTGSYYHSVHGIMGGGQALVNVLLELLKALDVEVCCRAEVDELLQSSGQVAGVRLSGGEEIIASEVVASLNPALLPDMLSPGVLRPAYVKRLKRLRQTTSAYVFFGRVPHPVEVLQGCNMFLLHKPGILSMGDGEPLSERPLYLASAEGGSKEDGYGIIGIVPASYEEVNDYSGDGIRRSDRYTEFKRNLSKQLQELFTLRCPELAGLEVLDLATPLTFRDFSMAPKGAIYGVGHYLDQYNPHPMTRLSGLYLSGQAIAAPGLMGAIVSSYLTCGSILGHETLRGELLHVAG